MFITKVYKYDSSQESNGYRGTDYTPYVLQGATFTEDITQELDTQEITLAGLTSGEEFAPETKFILDIVDQQPDQDIVLNTIHMCVSRDIVKQTIMSDETYYDHHIFFIEPSVVAQKRLVDNISTTYKLKDVTLEQTSPYDTSLAPEFKNQSSAYTPTHNFGKSRNDYFFDQQIVRHAGKYFQYEGTIGIYNPDYPNTLINTKYLDVSTLKNITTDPNDPKYQALIKIPKLAIYGGIENTMDMPRIGYASIDVTIEEYSLTDNYNPTSRRVVEFISKDNLATNTNFYQPYNRDLDWGIIPPASRPAFLSEWLFEYGDCTKGMSALFPHFQYKKYTDTNPSLPNPTYEIGDVEIRPDKNYVIKISLHEFSDDFPVEYYGTKYTGAYPTSNIEWDLHKARGSDICNYNATTATLLSEIQVNGITNYTTYLTDDFALVYTSSTPYSALALLQKAIVNSAIYEKQAGVYIADVNNSHLPFYIDPNYVNKLSGTAIIENFYNQKNLWEIAIEVGHYIHAIPELKFGSDDRFMFTFNELGRTDQKEDNATKISIFNSRSVEDYICATSSYVSNMVQLGGYIKEWVAPKTKAETLLVSNDTANITVSKPIIELLKVTVKCIKGNDIAALNATADMTDYIYEKNVYDTLSVRYVDVPNRGIAMYYELGTNSIDGGDFRSPTVNTGDKQNDLAFKKIIYCAFNGGYPTSNVGQFNGWANVKVNDFIFEVTYRTKDDVRQNHLRPDLRKYLLNSQYDKFPQHNQFNNQQDILVDSIKFGNNVYGKLIKTGNTEYTISEWNSDYNNVKHKGELYRIKGDLYYVAKATHTIECSNVVSEITYSKDYNELSAVIGIPSEPRFYEISEQSQIRREVAINEMLYLTTNVGDLVLTPSYCMSWMHIKNLMFEENQGFAQYALTVFKGDEDTSKYDQTVGEQYFYKEVFNPINAYSSENTLTYEWDMVDNYGAGDKVITPPSTPSEEYDENYNSLRAVGYTDVYGKAALMDFFILGESYFLGQSLNPITISNESVKNLPESPFRTKVDDGTQRQWVYDLNSNVFATNVLEGPFDIVTGYVNFETTSEYIGYYVRHDYTENGLRKTEVVLVDATNKDNLNINPGNTEAYTLKSNINYYNKGIGLLKDCREAVSFNYNVQLSTSSDTFVLSPFIFLPQKRNIKVVLLSEEVNKLSNGYLDVATFIQPYDTNDNPMNTVFDIAESPVIMGNNSWAGSRTVEFFVNLAYTFAQVNPKHFTGEDGYARIKAIAVICNVSLNPSGDIADVAPTIPNKTQFVVARNIPETFTQAQALANWHFGAPNKNIFTNKQ